MIVFSPQNMYIKIPVLGTICSCPFSYSRFTMVHIALPCYVAEPFARLFPFFCERLISRRLANGVSIRCRLRCLRSVCVCFVSFLVFLLNGCLLLCCYKIEAGKAKTTF